jgi:hypothetical protein
MKIPDGVNFYEFVLLILGVVLFIVLLFILITNIWQRRSPKSLIPFFIFPIIMIGFPGIKKISYENGVLTLETAQEKLAEDPNNSQTKEEIKEALSDLKNKNISNPQTLLRISKGYASIGDTINALTFIEKALVNDPKLTEAKKLKIKYNNPNVRIGRIINEMDKDPNDKKLRENLGKEVSSLTGSSYVNASTYRKLVDTYAIIGDTDKVLMFADSLIKVEPGSQRAAELKRNYMKNPR